jgi:hypothetical protein
LNKYKKEPIGSFLLYHGSDHEADIQDFFASD